LQLIAVDLKVPKKAIVIGIAILTIVRVAIVAWGGLAIGKFIGCALVAPSPPGSTTFAQIKFLPLAFAIFDKYRRTTIDPSGGSCGGASTTVGTAKSFGVSG
jgi:hypothetical protein